MELEKLEKLLGIKFITEVEGFDKFERPLYVALGKYAMIFENENQVQFFDEKNDVSKTLDPSNTEDLAFLTSTVNKIDEYI